MSRKRRVSRGRSRRVSRNRYVLVNQARGALRRLTRNVSVGGVDLIEKIVFPALGATGGMLLARYVGDKLGPRLLPGQDPRMIASLASLATAFAAYKAGEAFSFSPETQAAVAAGAGAVGLVPWLPFDFMRSNVAATMDALTPAPAENSVSGYYQSMLGGGLMVDVSHAGAPYKGMLGLGADPADQGAIDRVLSSVEAVSTVEPIDVARRAPMRNPTPKIRERMATPGGRGYAGGTFARDLFSGIMS